MTVRTMAQFSREPTEHTDWCARDHRCGAVEHRSPAITADDIGGRAVITRVRAGTVEYLEVRARIPLHNAETGARWQVATVLQLMRELLAAITIRPGVVRGRHHRPEVGPTPHPTTPAERVHP
jgi:hypothetical protein